MWKKIAPLLIVLSVALNVAFVGVWAVHAAGAHWGGHAPCDHGDVTAGIWCPLHRQLGISQEQWKQIEPRLVEFQKTSQAICQDVSGKRLELIDLMTAAQPDQAAISAKQEEIFAGQRKMQELVIEQLLAEKRVLTPRQQQELLDLLRQRSGCAGHGPMMMGLGKAGTTSSPSCGGTGPSE